MAIQRRPLGVYCAKAGTGLESAAPSKGAEMKRLICTALTLCLLLGVAAAQTKTTTKKPAAKAAAPAKAEAGSSHVKAYSPDQLKWGPAPNALPAGAQLA